MKVQGLARACAGSKASLASSAGEVKTVSNSSRTTALAMISRPPQGVIRGYGVEFTVLAPPNFLAAMPLRRPACPGDPADSVTQLSKIDSDGPGGLGQETGRRHAGQRIHL